MLLWVITITYTLIICPDLVVTPLLVSKILGSTDFGVVSKSLAFNSAFSNNFTFSKTFVAKSLAKSEIIAKSFAKSEIVAKSSAKSEIVANFRAKRTVKNKIFSNNLLLATKVFSKTFSNNLI